MYLSQLYENHIWEIIAKNVCYICRHIDSTIFLLPYIGIDISIGQALDQKPLTYVYLTLICTTFWSEVSLITNSPVKLVCVSVSNYFDMYSRI